MSSLKRIGIIINPATGVPVPVVSILYQHLRKTKLVWDMHISKGPGDITTLTKKIVRSGVDAVAVYGGDGTVLEAAAVLQGRDTPLIILPGGTANVMAKELGISTTLSIAARIFHRPFERVRIDMGECGDGHPMFSRIEVGAVAEMVKQAKRRMKRKWGVLAYPFSFFRARSNAVPAQYSLTLDGKQIETQGVALAIANAGNYGISGISIRPTVRLTDGLFDVFVLQADTIRSWLSVAAAAMGKLRRPPVLQHWQARSISLHVSPAQSIVRDDKELKTQDVSVRVIPRALEVLL